MGKQVTDIAQIRKYLNGELDARAMHQLEREAQDNPMLMDALEGYQNVKADQQANLGDLSSRLNERVSEKRSRIIPFRVIGIAASVLIICSAGVWWFNQGRAPVNTPAKNQSGQPEKPLVAKHAPDTTEKKAASSPKQYAASVPAPARPKTAVQPIAVQPLPAGDKSVTPPVAGKPVPAQEVLADAAAARPAFKDKDTTPLNEMIVMNYKSSQYYSPQKKDSSRLATLHEVHIKAKPDSAPEQRLQANVPGVKVYPNNPTASDLTRLMTRTDFGNVSAAQLMAGQVIQGKVIAKNNGLPIQGASVKVAGTNQITKTDASGFFRLPADSTHAKLEVTNKGYQASQVSTGANTRDSVKTIVLAPDQNDDLAETVVTGYTSQPRDADAVYITAHPQKGWADFRKYLKINAVSPDKATGIVKITFSVDKFGSISNIKVLKGLSDEANKKAVSVIKDGPDWVGNSNKRPEKVTLRIRFGK